MYFWRPHSNMFMFSWRKVDIQCISLTYSKVLYLWGLSSNICKFNWLYIINIPFSPQKHKPSLYNSSNIIARSSISLTNCPIQGVPCYWMALGSVQEMGQPIQYTPSCGVCLHPLKMHWSDLLDGQSRHGVTRLTAPSVVVCPHPLGCRLHESMCKIVLLWESSGWRQHDADKFWTNTEKQFAINVIFNLERFSGLPSSLQSWHLCKCDANSPFIFERMAHLGDV